MKRRIAAVLLALCMCIGLLPATALAANTPADNHYVTVNYSDGAMKRNITVYVYDENGNCVDTVPIDDARVADDKITISLTEQYKSQYDIEDVSHPDSAGTFTSKNVNRDSCSFDTTGAEGSNMVVSVQLCPEFKNPFIDGEKIDAATIYYRVTQASLLKLLHDNGVKVTADTKITNQQAVRAHFVEPYNGVNTEWPFDEKPAAANDLQYYWIGAGLTDVSDLGNPYNIRYIEITYQQGDEPEQKQKIYSGDLKYVNVGSDTYEIESNKNSGEHIVIFYTEGTTPDHGVWTPLDVRFVKTGQPVATSEADMPTADTYGGRTFAAWTQQHNGGLPVIYNTLVNDDMNVFPQYKLDGSDPQIIRVMNNDDLLKERVAELLGCTVENVDWNTMEVTVYGQDNTASNPDYGTAGGVDNQWHDDDYYTVRNYCTGASGTAYENQPIPVNDISSIRVSVKQIDAHDPTSVVIKKGALAGDFAVSMGSYSGDWLVELYINANGDYPENPDTPDPGTDPDYAITGITKDLVDSVEKLPDGVDQGVDGPFKFPDENGIVVISASEGSTTAYAKLLYKITVTGKEGATFTVTDPGAELVSPEDGTITEQGNQIDGNNTFSGTIPEGGQAVFYVSKMFSAELLEPDADSSTGTVLKNTATVETDDAGGVDPDEEDDTEETPAAEAQTIYTYIKFIGTGVNGALTNEDKAYIKETYGKEVDQWGYLAIGNFDAPLPDPTEEPYAPTGGQGTGGDDFKDNFLKQIKPYITDDDNFEWVDGLNSDKFDLANGVDWIKLSVANGATSIDDNVTTLCWHLDGQIKLYDSDISVTKELTKVVRNNVEQNVSDNMTLEVGDKLTWTITVTNTGNAAATGLKLTDKLIAVDKDGTEYTRTGVTLAGPEDVDTNNFTVPAATTDGPGKVEFTATYTVQKADKGLTLTNTATVSDGEGEVPGGEDETENPVADRKVEIKKELTSAKRGGVPVGDLTGYKAQVGDVLSYTITVTNEGNTELTGVKVTDSMWVGTEYAIKVNGTDNYAGADGFTIKDGIAVDGSVTITYTYTVTEADALKESISNSVDVYLDSTEPGGGEDPDDEAEVEVPMDDYTIDIEPANITIYTGGTGYAGVLENENGDLLNEPASGLPEPGYHIELPEAVNAWLTAQGVDTSEVMDLAELLHFAYDEDDQQREWGLTYMGVYDATAEGKITQYVYSLDPATDSTGKEIPVSILYFKDTDGDGELSGDEYALPSDDITMSATAASDKFTIAINPGELAQNKIQAVITVENDDGTEKTITCSVEVGTGTLTVKSTTDEEYVNEIGTVDNNQISATGSVDYYVNETQVKIGNDGENANRVQLLVDEVYKEDTLNTEMAADAIREVIAQYSAPSDAQTDMAYLDLVDTQNGNAVVTMGENQLLTIYWPMPEGAAPDGKFYIVHYTEMDRTDTGMQTAEPEVEEVFATQDDNHLTFTTDSFSPFVLVYEAKDTGGTDPGTEPDPGTDPNPGGGQDDSDPYLKFESNGGTKFDPIEADDSFHINVYDDDHYGSHIPTRPGYRFTGWYEDRNLTMRVDEDEELHVTGSKTVFAGWEETTVPSMLNGDDHYAYIQGYADGSVRPNANITRAQVATIFFRLLDEDVRDDNLTTYNTFPDVDEDYWANTAISTMASLGVINGRNSGLFDPDAYITRAEFAAICARFDDSGVDGITTFTDTVGHWAEDEISRAAALGWIQGYADGTFRPNQYITRAQAVTMINRVLCRLPETEDDLLTGMNTWTDCHVTDWFYLAIQEATNSHDFVAKDRVYESWTDLNRDPDWSRYE